jgi:CHAT domain-containing protein
MPDALAFQRERRHWRWLLPAGVVLGGVAIAGALLVPRDSLPPRHRLLMAGRSRATPGMLVGETSYRRWDRRTGSDSLDPAVGRALGQASANTEPLDRAVMDVLLGEHGRAIAAFELASRDDTTVDEALAGLSATYLARFESKHDSLDLLRAIQAADRGLSRHREGPAITALRFNRAIALARLGTRILAEKALREFENSEPQSGWRGEAQTLLREVKRPSVEEEWARVRVRIESPDVLRSEVETLVSQLPSNARAFAEEQLLPQWAAAVAAGDAARGEKALRLASEIGDVLQRAKGEGLLADAVRSIRRTVAGGSGAQREALVRGLQQFGVGVVLYHEQNLASANGPLTQAVRDLTIADHPLRHWANFYLAIGKSYDKGSDGLVILDRLLQQIPEGRYPALVGRIEWIAGTIDKVEGRLQSSVRRYERSAAALHRAGGASASAFVSVLLAESYTDLGEHSIAWGLRLEAFQHVPLTEVLRRRIAMWTEAKEALVHQGHVDLAGPLVEEAVATAELWGKPLGRVVAYLRRAEYRLQAVSRDAALADLQHAQSALSQMEASSLRNQETYRAQITEGLCYRTTDPARAARLVQEALERQRATGKKFDAITYTTALADAQIASGDLTAGGATLERAISMFEDIRATVEDPLSRMRAFQQAQPAFDRLIELHITSLPVDREVIFRLAERSRARVLLELTAGDRPVAFARLADLEKRLSPRITLVSFVVVNERILAWVFEGGRAREVTLQTSHAALEKEIDRFRLELSSRSSAASIQEAATPLYDHLIRPLALANDSNRPLVIVPDRVLARLPFAALFDRQSGQYLIEQRAVSVTPSATLLMQSDRANAVQTAPASALVLGISKGGTWRGRSLPVLRWAEREAERVAVLYPGAVLLRAADATRENFVTRALSSDVIHFAGHAVVDLDAPRRSVLLFTDASGRELAPLSLGEVLDAGLGRTRLVVLAACATQDSLADDREGLLGLAGAFIAAGVPEVVASPLDVDDDSVAPVMVAFHRHYRRHGSAAVAFREAAIDLLRSNSAELSSPAAWGPFTVIQGSLLKGERE